MATDPAMTSVLLTQARQAEELVELRMHVESLMREKSKGYAPKATVRWWRGLGEEETKAHLGKYRGWYEQVAVVTLAAPKLPDCALAHGLVRTVLDTASELWAVCFLPEKRTARDVAAQSEFLVRHWPALLDLMVQETKNCAHQRAAGMRQVAS